MWENEFITWEGITLTQLWTLLKSCTIIENQSDWFTVTELSTYNLNSCDKLAEKLTKNDFSMISKTNHSLILKLTECVIIDTVIHFTLSHDQLNEKFVILIRLISDRTELRHLTEHYLTVISTSFSYFFRKLSDTEGIWLINASVCCSLVTLSMSEHQIS